MDGQLEAQAELCSFKGGEHDEQVEEVFQQVAQVPSQFTHSPW